MEQLILPLVVLVVGLALGGAVGWFFASRPLADLRERLSGAEQRARGAEEALGEVRAQLSAAQVRAQQADTLERERSEERTKRMALSERLAEVEATAAERTKAFEEQKAALIEAREALLTEFRATGAEVLRANQEEFLKRAEARFRQSEETGEAKIKALLSPVGDRLKNYEEQVQALETRRSDAFAGLYQMIEAMRVGQEEVKREAQRLGNSLTNAPKARGRWGERALQNVLEQCGLAEHTDFHLEQSLDTDDGKLRPDAIVNVPGQKQLVIDAKVSLNAYQAAFEADDDAERKRHLDLHAKSMRGHVQTLGSKSYQSQFPDAPDYVVMFVPGEHFVAAALEHDPELWDFAFRNKVLLATPTNLVAIARTVAQVWRQDKMANEAAEIGRMGAELYDRLRVAAEHMKRVGGGLETAVNNYNKFVGSFERNVLTSGRRMAEKGLEIAREIEEVPLVESSPRYNAADADGVEVDYPALAKRKDAAE